MNHWTKLFCCDHIMDYGLEMTNKKCHFNVIQWLRSSLYYMEKKIYVSMFEQPKKRRKNENEEEEEQKTLRTHVTSYITRVTNDEQRQNVLEKRFVLIFNTYLCLEITR